MRARLRNARLPLDGDVDAAVLPAAACVALSMLRPRFGWSIPAAHPDGLLPFQHDGVIRLQDILTRYGGAILADSVGLGKTNIAAELIRSAAREGERVLVCGPAPLRRHWASHLHRTDFDWISHTTLSRTRSRPRRLTPGLIVVDEAHAFRNHLSFRYRALAELCSTARVLLVTATPVNNGMLDIYHLISLFAARTAFADLGVPDLFSAARAADGGDAADLRRVVEAVMVRRTRDILGDTPLSPSLRFPASAATQLIRYDLHTAYPGLLLRLHEILAELSFPAHSIGSHRLAAGELTRLMLLKRLESSTHAFRASIRRCLAVLAYFVQAARAGCLFHGSLDRSMMCALDGAVQLQIPELMLRAWPPNIDVQEMLARAVREEALLQELLTLTDYNAADPKLARLLELRSGPLAHCRVLIFTEYAATAMHLWSELAGAGGVGLLHGSEARMGRTVASRQAVIERFAPFANHARAPRPHQQLNTLIATDVIAEGLNLQDANAVISYDLPWNPVRLAQRIGRIDRLGSPHERISSWAFRPDQGIDEVLGLMTRISRKLRAIRTVGGDAPTFARKTPRGRSWAPRAGRSLEALEAESVERLRQEYTRALPRLKSGRGLSEAAMEWEHEYRGALCCFRRGAVTWLVLIAEGQMPRIGGALPDQLLLCALSGRKDVPVDSEWLRKAQARAAAAISRKLTVASISPDRSMERCARAVRSWLQTRPGGASDQDAAAADALLQALAGSSAAGRSRMLDALRSAQEPSGIVRELTAHRRTHTPVEFVAGPLTTVGALELVPRAGGGSAA